MLAVKPKGSASSIGSNGSNIWFAIAYSGTLVSSDCCMFCGGIMVGWKDL